LLILNDTLKKAIDFIIFREIITMKIVRNILAVIIGWAVGSVLNMGFIKLGGLVFPLEGLDTNDMNAYAEVIGTLEAEYFVFPFLAHALGTLVGAFVAYLIAATNKMKFSLGIGFLFFLGGLMVNYMLPGPLWFTILDLLVAYFPMAFLGATIGSLFVKNPKVA
jgi:hypothetical protein